MTLVVIHHPACLDHDTGPGHPESSGRLASVLGALSDSGPERIEAPRGTRGQALLAHTAGYVDRLSAAEPGPLDPDTWVSAGSWEAALRAVGGACLAVDRALVGRGPSFCATRPPGHHATADRAMGFCLLNSVAIAALHALAQPGVARVAVVDFDVHHGNGTQDILWDRPGAFYISTHQDPFYPGTGRASERGAYGNVTNIPLPGGTGGGVYRRAFTDKVLPALEDARPDLILVSAGFDAHADDPVGGMALTAGDFGWIGAQLRGAAGTLCGGRVVSTLEGGYDHTALAASAAAYARAF